MGALWQTVMDWFIPIIGAMILSEGMIVMIGGMRPRRLFARSISFRILYMGWRVLMTLFLAIILQWVFME